jgi:hypothetical protein
MHLSFTFAPHPDNENYAGKNFQPWDIAGNLR